MEGSAPTQDSWQQRNGVWDAGNLTPWKGAADLGCQEGMGIQGGQIFEHSRTGRILYEIDSFRVWRLIQNLKSLTPTTQYVCDLHLASGLEEFGTQSFIGQVDSFPPGRRGQEPLERDSNC